MEQVNINNLSSVNVVYELLLLDLVFILIFSFQAMKKRDYSTIMTFTSILLPLSIQKSSYSYSLSNKHILSIQENSYS